MEKQEFMRKLLEAQSPSGYEDDALDVFIKYCSDHGGTFLWDDNIKNTCFLVGSKDQDAKKIMISAHIDELGFQVQTITEKGLLHFIPLGGVDDRVLPGSRVLVQGKDDNLLPGIIGKKPIHVETTTEREELLKIEDLVIDIGAINEEDARKLVEPGSIATFSDTPIINFGNNRLVSRGLDDKSGVYVIAEVLRGLVENHKDTLITNNVAVYVVATTQEEVGLRGAEIAARRIDPHISIDLDVSIATDDGRDIKSEIYGKVELGKGPVISSGPGDNPGLVRIMKEVATRRGISYQGIARQPWGTNTCVIQTASRNCKTALIGIPNRNMHTQVEMCDWRDVDGAISLVTGAILKLTNTL